MMHGQQNIKFKESKNFGLVLRAKVRHLHDEKVDVG
jgi:hypothetical protein